MRPGIFSQSIGDPSFVFSRRRGIIITWGGYWGEIMVKITLVSLWFLMICSFPQPMGKKKSSKSAENSAESVAAAMVQNLAANMADPDYEMKREQQLSEAAQNALKAHASDLEKAVIIIPKKVWKIATIGDSLTEGGGRSAIIGPKISIPSMYQSWTYNWLIAKNVPCEIHNLGIGGQIISEICTRFNECVPADIIVTMAGTNDAWRFSDTAPGIQKEMAEDVIEWYSKVVPKALKLQQEKYNSTPIVFINSIPAIGNVKTVPKNMQTTVLYINDQLAKYVAGLKNPKIVFGDVHKAMRGSDGYNTPGNYIPDGVHFTVEGNKVVGEAIAQAIFNYLKKEKLI